MATKEREKKVFLFIIFNHMLNKRVINVATYFLHCCIFYAKAWLYVLSEERKKTCSFLYHVTSNSSSKEKFFILLATHPKRKTETH